MSLAQIAQGQGVSELLVRRVLKIENVEALATTAFKIQVDAEHRCSFHLLTCWHSHHLIQKCRASVRRKPLFLA